MNEPPKPIDVHKKLRWKNFYKFAGVLPNCSLFPLVKVNQIIKLTEDLVEIPRKRMWILILEYLNPKDLMFTVALLNKRFYALTWNQEVLKIGLLNVLGIFGYDELCLRIAQKLERQAKGKQLKRYKIIVEATSDDTDSGFGSTSDEHEFNERKSDSSTEEEQTVKECIRRKEMNIRKLKRWEKEFKTMQLKEKKLLLPKVKTFKEDQEEIKIDQEIEQNIDRIKDEIIKMKRKRVQKYIKEDEVFWRKLSLFWAVAKWCSNWCYYEDLKDKKCSLIILWPIIKKSLWYRCKISDDFRMISAANASYKYHIKKEFLERWNLKWMRAPNPYYGEGYMKLYYEHQVKQCLPLIEDLIKKDQEDKEKNLDIERTKRLNKKAQKRRAKATEVLIDELVNKRGVCTKEEVIEKYINHPYMQRFFEKRLKRKLCEVVALINTGKASKLEEQANQRKRKRIEEIRLEDSKKTLIGNEKYNERKEEKRQEKSSHTRKKSRKEKMKDIIEKERNRRKLKLSESELLNDYYNNLSSSDSTSSNSSSSSSLEDSKSKSPKKNKEKNKKFKDKHKNKDKESDEYSGLSW